MRGALRQRLAPWWRGVGLASAGLVLSLAVLVPATAAPAKKPAKAAETRASAKAKSAAAAAAAPKAAAQKTTKADARGKKEAPARQAAAKGKGGKAEATTAKAGPRGQKSGQRNVAQRQGGKQQVARGKERVQRTLAAKNNRAEERATRVAAQETRLSLRPVAAHAPQEVRPARLSFGQMAGLRAVDDPLELKSSVALVMDQDSHEVLFSKNDHAVLPIASLTKLMTGLIVSDARLPLDEMITITEEDIDTEKGSRSRLARVDFGASSDLFFIILFVLAGARLHVAEVLHYAPLAFTFVQPNDYRTFQLKGELISIAPSGPEDVAAAERYAASDDGRVPWRERPPLLKSGLVARIPPQPETRR